MNEIRRLIGGLCNKVSAVKLTVEKGPSTSAIVVVRRQVEARDVAKMKPSVSVVAHCTGVGGCAAR